jgi:hypothetical protein
MKLPITQSIKPPISANNNGSGPSSPIKNSESQPSKTVNAKALDQLSNTWGKVKSSQPLSSDQVSKIQIQGNKAHISNPLSQQVAQLAEELSVQSKDKQASLTELKLFLVKLETQQGLLSLLSQKAYPKGNNLLITLDAKGMWQLQAPSQGFSLNNLSAQFSGNQSAPPALNLSAASNALAELIQLLPTKLNSQPQLNQVSITAQNIGTSTETASVKIPPIPPSMLKSDHVIDLTAVQNALKHSGQTLENQLAQSIKQPSGLDQRPEGANSSLESPNFKGRFQQVEQQVNRWVKQLTSELKHSKTSVSLNEAIKPLTTDTTAKSMVQNERLTPTQTPAEISIEIPTKVSAASIATSDSKSWLMKHQNVLITELSQTMMKNNSFIPNWASAGTFKNADELNALFNLLLAPKHAGQSSGQSIWPNNLSAQSQINQTLQLLITHSPDTEKDSAQNQLLRQIFNVNQSLMKMQHDQIHNRLGQQQPDSPTQLQMSIPYAHQNNIQWAELELKEFQPETNSAEKTTGWHLILRFEQDTSQAFSVETQLKQDQLSVVLWANEKIQLKRLNQDIPLFKEKLNHAGFKLESITTKHGSPNKIQKPIQQSLVDVHT